MTTYSLKKRFQDFLRPVAYGLDGAGITPNQITLGTCVLSLIFAIWVVLFKNIYTVYFLFPVFFFLRMALNAIDGIIAKEKNKTSTVGALLNEVCDLVSDFFLVSIFFFTTDLSPHWIWMFIYLSIFVECSGMWSYYIRGERSYKGPLGKSDRGIVLTLVAFTVGIGVFKGQVYTRLLEDIFVVANLLLLWTVLNRLKFAAKK